MSRIQFGFFALTCDEPFVKFRVSESLDSSGISNQLKWTQTNLNNSARPYTSFPSYHVGLFLSDRSGNSYWISRGERLCTNSSRYSWQARSYVIGL